MLKSQIVPIGPKDLIGCTFLKDSEEEEQRFNSHVVCVIIED
jgi:hypothetical protein